MADRSRTSWMSSSRIRPATYALRGCLLLLARV
jgi:hypothetical protein